MVELGKNTAWGWEELMLPTDCLTMETFYGTEENQMMFWTPDPTVPWVSRACPQMLALPPECVCFCAKERRTPAELRCHAVTLLCTREVDPAHSTY